MAAAKKAGNDYEIRNINRQLHNRYTENSAKPYTVTLQNPSDTDNLGFMNPIAFSTKLMHAGIEFSHSTKVDKKKIELQFDSFEKANKALELRDKIPDGWYAYIPDYKAYSIGVIKGIELEYSVDEIKSQIETDYPGTKVERLMRRKRTVNRVN